MLTPKKIVPSISVVLFLIFTRLSTVSADETTIQGMVTTFDSIPLINASISVKGSKKLVYTDTIGMFMVSCEPNDKLVITARGFSKKRVKVKEGTRYVLVNLKLLAGPENRELAIGYGHVRDADKLFAVSNVNENDINFANYRNMHDVISDRFATEAYIRNDGEIIIRGALVMQGNEAALLIVDGREVDAFDFANISTQDIASINLLKDASSAVYGSRGGNGVVIVETKRGLNK